MSKSKEGHLAFYSLKARWDCSCEWTHKSSLVSRSKSVKKVSNHNCWNADRLLQPSCLGWTFCLKTALWINKTGLFLFSSFCSLFLHSTLEQLFFPLLETDGVWLPMVGSRGWVHGPASYEPYHVSLFHTCAVLAQAAWILVTSGGWGNVLTQWAQELIISAHTRTHTLVLPKL